MERVPGPSKRPAGEGGSKDNVFTYDETNQTLVNSSLGTRVMVLDTEFYQALASNLTSVFGTGAQVFLYQMGLAYGQTLGKRVVELGHLDSSTPEDYLRHYTSLAVGKFEWPQLALLFARAPAGFTVGLRDSFIARALGKTGQAECHIVRGLLEGAAKTILKADYSCAEVKCLSKGDWRCEFFLTPAKPA